MLDKVEQDIEITGTSELLSFNDPENSIYLTFLQYIDDYFVGNTGSLKVFNNGNCCYINKDDPYFIGWESNTNWSDVEKFEIEILDESIKCDIDEYLQGLPLKDKEPRFFIMTADCLSCT